jgi:hypothetical protein
MLQLRVRPHHRSISRCFILVRGSHLF